MIGYKIKIEQYREASKSNKILNTSFVPKCDEDNWIFQAQKYNLSLLQIINYL
jgi:hypothetical protein